MSFSDRETNKVYYSEFFKLRFPGIFETSKVNLESNGIKVETIGGNQNIWIRDWSPCQVGDHFVRFGYKGYGEAENPYADFPWLIVPDHCFEDFKPLVKSSIVLDGGGIIREREKAVITEKVFLDNREIPKEKVVEALEKVLESEIIIIPVEPEDTLGHADGICKFVDSNTLLINDYSSMFPKSPDHKVYNEKLHEALKSTGLKLEYMPYAYEGCVWDEEDEFYRKYPFSDDQNPGYGYYINFLLTKTTIIAPVFGIKKDVKAIETLKRLYPKHSVVAVNCTDLSYEGGLTNCTSWNIKE